MARPGRVHPPARRLDARAALLLLAILLPSTRSAHAQGTVLIRGEPGESMTGGATFYYAPPTATTGFGRTTGGIGCTVYAPAATWDFRFFGQGDHDLGTGVYHTIGGYTTNNEPAVAIDYGLKACHPIADLEVRRLAWAPDGVAREVWIVWSGSCSAGSPRLFGEIRLNADTTLWQEHPGDVWAFGGDSAAFTTRAHCVSGHPVGFVADSLPEGASFTDAGDGTADFRWRTPAVNAPTMFAVRVVATDDAGADDTTTTWIHAMPALKVGYGSQPGDAMGQGVPDTLRDPRTQVEIREIGGKVHPLNLQFKGGGGGWAFEFDAPMQRRLAEGTYESAQGSPTSALVRPGLSVSTRLGNVPCMRTEGRFEIRRLRRDAAGLVTGLWAVVDGRCVGASGAIRAEVLYNADTTLYVRAPADVFVEPGDSIGFDVEAVDTRTGQALLDHGALPTGVAFEPLSARAGRLVWTAPSAPVDDLPVIFTALASDGTADTVTTHLHVRPVGRFHVVGDPGHCQLDGKSFLGTNLDGQLAGAPSYPDQVRASYISTNDRYELWLWMPTGEVVRKGDYSVLRLNAAWSSPLWAGMKPVLGSYGYETRYSHLHVRKFSRDGSGTVTSLWALWDWSCWYEAGHPTAYGEIRFNADTSLYTRAPAFVPVERGRPVRFGVRAAQAFGAPAQVAGAGLPAGATLAAAGDSATFDWPAASPVGSATATFVSTDDAGDADTLTSVIQVFEPRWLKLDAVPGEWATGGGLYQWNATNSEFGSYNDGKGLVSIQVHSWQDDWVARFGAPTWRPLTPGFWENPLGANIYNLSRAPKLTAIRNGRTNMGTGQGWMHVRKVELAADGRPSRLWAVFEAGAPAQRITGEVLYGDPDTTLYLTAPGDLFVNPGDSVTFAVRSSHARHRPVSLSATGVPAGAEFHAGADGTAEFRWRAPEAGGVDWPVKVFAADDEGLRDSCVVVVHVVVPASLVTVSIDPYEPIGRGESYSTDSRESDFTVYRLWTNGASIGVQTRDATWYLHVRAPGDEPLAPGPYPGAVGSWYAGASDAVFDIERLAGSDCAYYGTGRFDVYDVGYDSAGVVNRLWMTFEDRCSANGPALTGELRFGAIDQAVPALASRRLVTVVDGEVRILWRVSPEAGTAFQVERHTPSAPVDGWRPIAVLAPDGSGDLQLTDRDVAAGGTYTYRLVQAGAPGAVLDEVEVSVGPAAPFSLAALGPNPARTSLSLRSASRWSGPVDVTVTDVAGRVVLKRVLGSEASGTSEWQLPLPPSLPAGVYLLRARGGGTTAVRRFVLIR